MVLMSLQRRRMALPCSVITIRSSWSVTSLTPMTAPLRSVALIVMMPPPPRCWPRYSLSSVRLPWPCSHAGGAAAQRADVSLREADGDAVLRGDEQRVGARRVLHLDEDVALVERDRDDAAAADVLEVRERSLLDRAVARAHREEALLALLLLEGADGDGRGHFLLAREREEVHDGLAAGGAVALGDLV